ncbi:hypothetical protein AV530_019693 [Patagioenas fasciata monilis]|uniref:Uncharacterized protein n=1 Tax=Patagioenas fasciata monilis TaxID=372326 RepID=A0A1V4JEV6_PATFA|nr:hypothetical protein AV530_019693 [Patagioenas fasciata monilis]
MILRNSKDSFSNGCHRVKWMVALIVIATVNKGEEEEEEDEDEGKNSAYQHHRMTLLRTSPTLNKCCTFLEL